MEELEKLEYPKPQREFVYATFNAFADRHPWVGEENIRPKSIAREMFENFRSFADYVRDYELQRVRGPAAAASHQRLQGAQPDRARRRRRPTRCARWSSTCATLLRQVDSSLRGRVGADARPELPAVRAGGPARRGAAAAGAETAPPDITRDAKAFTAAIRTRIFTFLRAWAHRRPRRPPSPRSTHLRRRRGDAARGRRSGCGRRSRPTASSTAASGSIPRRATSATPTSTVRRRRAPGACSRCSSTPTTAQRLDGGVRGGPGRLARGEPAGAVAAPASGPSPDGRQKRECNVFTCQVWSASFIVAHRIRSPSVRTFTRP